MKANPLVSIIVNNYNYGRFLKDSIDSALLQNYKNIEIIVVDDGSTDNSYEIIQEYGNKIIGIRKENGGQASAFNTGFNVSSGDIILFLDSDDVLLATTIEKAVAEFDEPDVIKVHWPLYIIDYTGIKTGKIEPDLQLVEGLLLDKVLTDGPGNDWNIQPPTSGNAWTRYFLEKVIPIPEQEYKGCADYYLALLVQVFGKIRKISEPQGLYRIHGDNLTHKPMDTFTDEIVTRYDFTCHILESHLKKMGIIFDSAQWPETWFHKLSNSLKEINSIIPRGSIFILANGDHWKGGKFIKESTYLPFMERNGEYFGNPASDISAIQEIERQRASGAKAIIFVWTMFWLLDYYEDMYKYLRNNYTYIINNDRLIGFDLQNDM